MPTRLDDATIRVRLLVDDETRRKAKPGGSTAARKRELADQRPSRKKKTRAEQGAALGKAAEKLARETQAKRVREARFVRGIATRPIGTLREAAREKITGTKLGKKFAGKAATGALTVVAFTKLLEDALPLITTVVVTGLEEATGFKFNSGQAFIDSISDAITEEIARVRGLVIATGRTFNEAEARARLAQAAGVTLDPAQQFQGLADTVSDVQEIEREKRRLERSVTKQKNRNLVRQVIKSVLGD